MTVSSSTNRVSYSGNGTLTAFAYTFKIFDEDDLTVILRASDGTETVQTITTHYTVSGVGDAGGGNVTFVTAPASGVTVVILREQPLTQGLDLVPNDPFPAASLEEALDKLVFMTQKHEEELGRAIKASRTNTLTGSEFTISAADRANKVFSFDSSGDLSVTQELGTFKGDWAASTAYVERDLVKDTTTNNVFIVTSAHTSSGSLPLTTNTNSAKYEKIIDITNPPGDVTFGGSITTSSSVTAGSFVIGSADINENDLEAIDSVTAGTVAASKAVVVDVNKDISSFRNLTATGDITFGGLSDGTITVTAFVDEDNMASDSATLVPTQQSVKAYVDSQVGASDTLTEILGNGNTTSGANIQLTTTDELQFRDTALKISSSVDGQLDIDADTKVEITAPTVDINATNANFTGHALFGDDDRVKFGDSQDAYLEWTSIGYFTARSTGRFDIQSDGNDLRLVSNTNIGLTVNHTGGTPAVHLYNSGTERLATTSTGIDVTGTITSDSIAIDTDVLYVDSTNDRVGINTTSPDRDLTVIGTGHFGATTAGVALSNSASVGVIYGMTSTGSFTDLQIASAYPSSFLYFDADGTIGIDTTSPNDFVSTGTNFVIGGGSGHNGMTIASGSTSYGTIYFADGTTGDALDAGYIRYQHQYDRMSFVTSSSTIDAIRITSAGDVGIGLTGDPSTKLDVNGTITADGLTVDGGTGNYGIEIEARTDFTGISGQLAITDSTGSAIFNTVSGSLNISTGATFGTNTGTQRLQIGSGGDISFYEDTGTTAKFFWDASAESLGIGTSSPKNTLTLGVGTSAEGIAFSSGGNNYNSIWYSKGGGVLSLGTMLRGSTTVSNGFVSSNSGNYAKSAILLDYGAIKFYTDPASAVTEGDAFTPSQAMIIDSSGNVGIGTTSPDVKLHVSDGALRVAGTETAGSFLNIAASNTGSDGVNILASYYGSGSYGPIKLWTGGSERMRIDSSGNVGIGTSSPSSYAKLHVDGGSGNNSQLFVTTTDNADVAAVVIAHDEGLQGGLTLSSDKTNGVAKITTNNSSFFPLVFEVRGSDGTNERMRIDSSGNLLVGTTSTEPRNFASGTYGIRLFSSQPEFGVGTMYINRSTGTDGNVISFRKDGGTVGSISVTSSATAYNTSSDYRLKENVVDLTDATTRLKQLEPKRFNFIADADTTVDGFLAHEVQTVVPEAITGTHNEVDADGNPVYQGIDQSKLVPLLVATIKELEARITALEAN